MAFTANDQNFGLVTANRLPKWHNVEEKKYFWLTLVKTYGYNLSTFTPNGYIFWPFYG